MPKTRYKPLEIVGKLRQADLWVSQSQNWANGIRQIGVVVSNMIGRSAAG
jgi:hypothetical protein